MEEINFIPTDIVVWNGIITQYGSISHLANREDKIVLANEEEVKSYKKHS